MSAPDRARQTTPPGGSSQNRGDAHNPTTGKTYSRTIHVHQGAARKDEDKPKMLYKDLPAEIAAKALETLKTFIIHPDDKTTADKPLPFSEDFLRSLINIVDPATIKKLEVPKEGRIFKTSDGKKITVDELLGVRKQDSKIVELQKKLDGKANELQEKYEELKTTEKELKEKDDELKKIEKELKDTKVAFENKESEMNEMLQVKEITLIDIDEKYKQLVAKNEELDKENKYLCDKFNIEKQKLEADIRDKTKRIQEFETQMEQTNQYNTKLWNDLKQFEKKCQNLESKLNRERRTIECMKEDHEDEIRKIHNQTKDLVAERDDLRNRFSKLAGAKLTDQNPDIADLSDPNRAMKLSDKFGELYDDQWTDAFEALQRKKKTVREAIEILLNVLKKCEEFFKKLREEQMDSLKNVLLHPSQDISKFGTEARKHVGGLKEHERLTSADKKAIRELRRQVGVSEGVLEEVKQVFLLETKKWEEKKLLESCTPYLQRCAELCWLIVTHDPPLYIKMDVKHGDRMDLNLYNRYSSSGSTIDYLVWPALFNEKDGGLLSKGTAEPIRTVKKD